MKIKMIALILCVALFANYVKARIISIQDWDGSHTARSTSEESGVVRCAEECPEYSITITACNPDENMVLEPCPVKGCRYYYRCVSAPIPEN